MTLYLDTADGFRAWAGEAIADILHPPSIETLWTDEELAAVGLCRPASADPVPDGKIIASTTVERVDGVVRYVNTLAEAPPPGPYTIAKTLPWTRMTDDEADRIYTAMQSASPKLRGIYDAAQFLSSADPLWSTLHDMIAAVLASPSRADELLAPDL